VGKESCLNNFSGRPDGKKPLGKPKLRWEYNIKMNLEGVGWRGMDLIAVTEDRDM
jgi:hypothetical protein